jgi:hypothetical protein
VTGAGRASGPPFSLGKILHHPRGANVNEFLKCNAGKGTIAIVMACLFIVWRDALNFTAASLLTGYGIMRFRQSFGELDAGLDAAAEPDAEASA